MITQGSIHIVRHAVEKAVGQMANRALLNVFIYQHHTDHHKARADRQDTDHTIGTEKSRRHPTEGNIRRARETEPNHTTDQKGQAINGLLAIVHFQLLIGLSQRYQHRLFYQKIAYFSIY